MPRSSTEWAVLDELRKHFFDTYKRGDERPVDPGWHPCSCGWEGYWSDWQPHVAERIVTKLDARSKCVHCGVFVRKAANNLWIAEDETAPWDRRVCPERSDGKYTHQPQEGA